MKNKTFKEWVDYEAAHSNLDKEYEIAKRNSFIDFIEGELRAYLHSTVDDKWSVEDFFKAASTLWGFPSYKDWLLQQYDIYITRQLEKQKPKETITSVEWFTPY